VPNVWRQRRAKRVRCTPGLDARTEGVAREFERDGQSSIQLSDHRRRQGADVVSEGCLGQAHEFVAVNAAFVLETLVDTDVDLSVKAITTRVDRGADDS